MKRRNDFFWRPDEVVPSTLVVCLKTVRLRNFLKLTLWQVERGSRATRRHPCNDPSEDVAVGVMECGLYAIACVSKTSNIVGVTSVGETSVLPLYILQHVTHGRRDT